MCGKVWGALVCLILAACGGRGGALETSDPPDGGCKTCDPSDGGCETDLEFCSRLTIACGTATGIDDCGQERTVQCGDPCSIAGDAPAFGVFEVEAPSYMPASTDGLHVVDVGAHYLAVWSHRGSIVGARVNYEGELLDPGGIWMIRAPQDYGLFRPQSYLHILSLAYDGSEILIAVRGCLAEDPFCTTSTAFFDRDGRPIHGPSLPRPVQVVFDGTNLIYVSRDAYAYDLRAMTITPGTLEVGPEYTISTAPASDVSLAVHDGTTMISWREAGDQLMTSVLAPDASPLVPGGVSIEDPVGIAVLGESDATRTLHGTSAGFAMLHENTDPASGRRLVHASFFDAAGEPIAEPPLALYDPAGTGSSNATAAAFGSTLLVVLTQNGECEGYVVDAATRAVTSGPIVLPDCGRIECNATECTVVMSTDGGRLDRYTPAFERISSTEPAVISDGQYDPMVAFDGSQFAILWTNNDGFRVRRLSRDGRWLDETPIAVPVAGPTRSSQINGFPNGGFLVRWLESEVSPYTHEHLVRRMNADGSWAGPPVSIFSDTAALGSATCSSEACLVTFEDYLEGRCLYVVLSEDGAVLAGPTVVWSAPEYADDRRSATAYLDGVDAFLLSFMDDSSGPLHVVSIAATGASVGEPGESYDVEMPGDTYPRWTWHRFGDEELLLTSNEATEARTFTPGVGFSEPWLVADPEQGWLLGAFSDQQLHLVFQKYDDSFHYYRRLSTTRIDRYLGIVETGVPLFDGAPVVNAATIADGNRALLAFSRDVTDPGFGNTRVRAAFLGDRSSLLADDATCIDDGQCAGARCRERQCCDECPLWNGF